MEARSLRAGAVAPISASPVDSWDFKDSALLCVSDKGLITAAAGVEQLLGWRDDELLGRHVDTILEQPGVLTETLNQAADAVPPGIEVRCRRRDGTGVLMMLRLATVYTAIGVQIWATVREGSRARRDQVNHRLLTSLAHWSTEAVISATLDGEITFWNPAAERLYGYPAEEVLGQPVSLLYVEDPQLELGRWMPQVARGETVRIQEARRRCRDGTVMHGTVTVSPIADAAGTIIGAASLTHPVQPSGPGDSRFRALLEAVTIAIIGVDREGQIAMVNARAEQVFGYAAAELVGRPIEVLVPAAFHDVHQGLRDTYLTDPHTRPMGTGLTLFAQHKDGSQFPVEVSLAAIGAGSDLLVAASVRDLTNEVERVRLEREIQHTRRLESIGQLAGGVAHGFNNLISVIDGYTRFIREVAQDCAQGDPGSSYHDIAEDADRVIDAAARAAGLARQLLAFARADSTEPQFLDLGVAVRAAAELLQRTLGEHIRIKLRLTDTPQRLVADPSQIEQIIMNAAVNARDAMPGGGTVTIDTSTISLDPAGAHQHDVAPGRYARLRIGDTGSGMAADVAAKAFDPFYTTKPVGEGTGLGLSTIYGIVTGYRGHASLASVPGQGTTLCLLLPLQEEAGEAPVEPVPPAAPPVPAASAASTTILVVDDEPEIRHVVERILTRAGHRVLTAEDGSRGLDVIRHHPGPIGLVITDVLMPKMVGPEFARRLADVRPGTPVIFMSGYAQPALDAEGSLGAEATLLEKPFTSEQLLASIRSVLTAG